VAAVRGGHHRGALAALVTSLVGAAIAAVFLSGGIGGYTSAWHRRFGEQPFATLDRLAYSPLCLLLGAGYIALLL
jgi:hypothetical protein